MWNVPQALKRGDLTRISHKPESLATWHQAPACHGDAFQQKCIVVERKHLEGLRADGATLGMVVMVTILPISSHLTPHPFSVTHQDCRQLDALLHSCHATIVITIIINNKLFKVTFHLNVTVLTLIKRRIKYDFIVFCCTYLNSLTQCCITL